MGAAGSFLTEHLQKVVAVENPHLAQSLTPQIMQQIKEEHCFVAQNYPQEIEDALTGGPTAGGINTPSSRMLKNAESQL